MAYVAGKSGNFTISGTKGFSGMIEWTEEYDIVTNASMLTVNLKLMSTKYSSVTSSGDVTYWPNGTIKVDNNAIMTMSSINGSHALEFMYLNYWWNIRGGGGGYASFPVQYGPIYHDADGNKTITIALDMTLATIGGVGGHGASIVGSQQISLTSIPRRATITEAPNFFDNEKPTIKYSNPAGSNVTSLRACITLDGSNENVDASVAVAYRDLPPNGTSYTFNDITAEELYKIQYATTGGNSRKVWFKIKTVIGDYVGNHQVERTFTISNPNPTFSPVISDNDSTMFNLTGNPKMLVKYYSDAKITPNATAVKGASLETVKVTCNGKAMTNSIIENVESDTFVFYAKDNRGNETTKIVTPSDGLYSFVNYIKLSCYR